MICYGCKKKVDPILTFARPHGRYSKCEECRKKAREAAKKKKAENTYADCDDEGGNSGYAE